MLSFIVRRTKINYVINYRSLFAREVVFIIVYCISSPIFSCFAHQIDRCSISSITHIANMYVQLSLMLNIKWRSALPYVYDFACDIIWCYVAGPLAVPLQAWVCTCVLFFVARRRGAQFQASASLGFAWEFLLRLSNHQSTIQSVGYIVAVMIGSRSNLFVLILWIFVNNLRSLR